MSADTGDVEHAEHAGRVTVDLDAKDYAPADFRIRALRIWHGLDRDADDVEVHVSSSGLGLHFVGWFRDSLPFHKEIAMRRQLGDDQRRISMDIQRWQNGLYTGVLFEEKSSRPHDKERGFRDVYDALDFIMAQRDDAHRMERLINHGHKGAPELAARVGQ